MLIMAPTIERRKSAVQVYDLMQFGREWKLRRGRQDVVVGSGLEVVLFLKKLTRDETLIRMGGDESVTVLKAIKRVNYVDRADWESAS
jgi:hypothetical protein